MVRDIQGTTKAMRVWGALLNLSQLFGGIAFIFYLEGQLVLATVIFTLVVAGQIHKRARFSRLTGLCHIPWLVLLPWLIYRMQVTDPSFVLSIWTYLVCLLISISLVFDFRDIYYYFQGHRTFAWSQRG